MTEQVVTAANWAVWAKHPGSNDEYSVLSCSSGPFGRADFAAIVSRFAAGTPSAHEEGPGSLPWVTLSWVGVDENLHLGIAVQDSARQVDGAGRPITRTSYFCVPFGALAPDAVSYASLYEQVRELELPAVGGAPVPLRLRPLDTEELALSLEDFGEDAVCTTACMLLCGPVSMIRADASGLEERLRFLDAVAAMLPYGYRAKYTAATWSDSGIRHRIRLSFAERPRENACAVIWRQPADMSAGSPAARRYLAQLDRVRGRSVDSGVGASQTDVIEHIAGCAVPNKFEDAQYAIACVRQIDLPFAVLADLRAGDAEVAEIRQVLDQPRIEELTPDGRRTVLAALIRCGDPADLPRLERWWDGVVADRPGAVLPAMTATARRMLWAPTPGQAVQSYLKLAARSGVADDLLAGLITPPGGGAIPSPALASAAQLLADWIFASGLPGRRQRVTDRLASDYQQTLAALPANPAVACEMAAQLAVSGPDARSAVDWLAALLPDLLAPFQAIVAARPHPVGSRAIGQLHRAGWDCVRTLLAAASMLGRPKLVVEGMTAWLMECGPLDELERSFWRDQLLELESRTGGDQAGVDIALLVIGDQPRWLLSAALQPDWAAYREGFVSQAASLGLRPGMPNGDLLSQALCRYLDAPGWPASARQAIAVADLIQRLTEGDRKSILLGLVASILWGEAAVRQHAATDRWLARTDRASPGLIHRGVQYSLRRLPAGVPLERAAAVSERAFLVGLNPDDGGKAFAISDAMAPPARGGDILAALLEYFGVESGRDRSGAMLRRLTQTRDPDGDSDQSDSGRRAPGRLPSVISRLLGRASGDSGAGGELSREQREEMKRLQDWLDGFTRSAAKTWQRRLADRPDLARGRPWQATR